MSDIKDDEFLSAAVEDGLEEDQLPQELLQEIDLVLGEAVQEDGVTLPESNFDFSVLPAEEVKDYGVQEMQNTLLDMVSHTLSPLSRYVKAFTLGANYEIVLELCDLLVTPILSRLKEVELHQHHDELTFFKSVLHFAKSETDPKGREVMKNVVYRSFKELQKKFHISYRGSKAAVKNLIWFLDSLKKNSEISQDMIERFFAIGVPSLTWVRKTKSEELSSLSGIPIEQIRKIRLLAKDQRPNRPAVFSDTRLVPRPVVSYDNITEKDIEEPFVIQIADEEKLTK